MLYLESVRVTKSGFGIELLTFRVCQGNLWHFSNKVKSSHFSLCLVGRTFWSLTVTVFSGDYFSWGESHHRNSMVPHAGWYEYQGLLQYLLL